MPASKYVLLPIVSREFVIVILPSWKYVFSATRFGGPIAFPQCEQNCDPAPTSLPQLVQRIGSLTSSAHAPRPESPAPSTASRSAPNQECPLSAPHAPASQRASRNGKMSVPARSDLFMCLATRQLSVLCQETLSSLRDSYGFSARQLGPNSAFTASSER